MRSSRGADPVAMLAKVPLFKGCSNKELRLLDRAATVVDFAADTVICRQGSAARELVVLLDGEARVDIDGTEIAVVGPGGFIGELSLLDGGPRTASVTTITPSRALVLPPREFAQVIQDVPSIAGKMLASLASRLRAADARAFPH